MTHIVTWWIHLSFSQGAIVIIGAVVILGSLWCPRALRPRPQATPVRRRVPYVVDYSAARAKAIEWLGDDYLLAKPVNRRVRT